MSSQLTTYQERALQRFISGLPKNSTKILELGSDLEANVVKRLTSVTGCEVVGINPAPNFPAVRPNEDISSKVQLMRTDGLTIPLADESIDGVFTVATVEHVLDLNLFYSEIQRVLKPGGVLFASFEPIWSSGLGHHTYAVLGEKEARYWKPGRNPVPDFAHLLWTADEMRSFLLQGPCDNALVEPIVEWIYEGDGVNRVFLEEHLGSLEHSELTIERLHLVRGVPPDPPTESRLLSMYGVERSFDVSGVEVTMRKCVSRRQLYSSALRRFYHCYYGEVIGLVRLTSPLLRRSRTIRRVLNRRWLKNEMHIVTE